jgi:hypothetical protein
MSMRTLSCGSEVAAGFGMENGSRSEAADCHYRVV